MDINSLGQKIKTARESQELSLEALAGVAKVAKNTIHALEKGEGNPTLGTIESVADKLGIDFADLLLAAAGTTKAAQEKTTVGALTPFELEKMIQANLGYLRPDERQLIKFFRKLSSDDRESVINLAQTLGTGNSKKTSSRRTGL